MKRLSTKQKDIGERLLQDCPNDDCIVYRNVYKMYTNIMTDYDRLAGTITDETERAIQKDALRLLDELTAMYFTNYAVQEYKRGYMA